MADTISFSGSIYRIQTDAEGETKVIFVVPASDASTLTAFHARNLKKPLGCALTVDESTEYKGTEENITTGEIKGG